MSGDSGFTVAFFGATGGESRSVSCILCNTEAPSLTTRLHTCRAGEDLGGRLQVLRTCVITLFRPVSCYSQDPCLTGRKYSGTHARQAHSLAQRTKRVRAGPTGPATRCAWECHGARSSQRRSTRFARPAGLTHRFRCRWYAKILAQSPQTDTGSTDDLPGQHESRSPGCERHKSLLAIVCTVRSSHLDHRG